MLGFQQVVIYRLLLVATRLGGDEVATRWRRGVVATKTGVACWDPFQGLTWSQAQLVITQDVVGEAKGQTVLGEHCLDSADRKTQRMGGLQLQRGIHGAGMGVGIAKQRDPAHMTGMH